MGNHLNMESQFINEQNRLYEKIELINRVDINCIRYVAGVDLAYWWREDKEYAVCCIVIIDFITKKIVEKKWCMDQVNIPYIPGCLAFREIELILKTVPLLNHEIDLYVFDGNGYLHPRHMGLATHAGILLNKPSIGVAKSYYRLDDINYTEPENKEFSYNNIEISNTVYGRVVRTHKDVKPIFLSIGNKIDIETAMGILRELVTKESHIPIPTRYADIMTRDMRKILTENT